MWCAFDEGFRAEVSNLYTLCFVQCQVGFIIHQHLGGGGGILNAHRGGPKKSESTGENAPILYYLYQQTKFYYNLFYRQQPE